MRKRLSLKVSKKRYRNGLKVSRTKYIRGGIRQ